MSQKSQRANQKLLCYDPTRDVKEPLRGTGIRIIDLPPPKRRKGWIINPEWEKAEMGIDLSHLQPDQTFVEWVRATYPAPNVQGSKSAPKGKETGSTPGTGKVIDV